MKRTNKALQGRVAETHWWEVAGGAQRARVMPRWHCEAQGIPQGTLAVDNVGAKKQKLSESEVRRAGGSSGVTARSTGRSGTIHQNIIGRRLAVARSGLRAGLEFRGQDRAFALFHEPASEHGRGVFLEPLIEEFANLLAEIGGVTETREFIGLQGSARSGEKEFPGSLGTKLRHGALPKERIGKYHRHINTRVIVEASTFRITGLWKSVEKKEGGLRLCSGCAGDYEDPDRSAWEGEKEEVEEMDEAKGVEERKELPG